jgi:hypothetical protein
VETLMRSRKALFVAPFFSEYNKSGVPHIMVFCQMHSKVFNIPVVSGPMCIMGVFFPAIETMNNNTQSFM